MRIKGRGGKGRISRFKGSRGARMRQDDKEIKLKDTLKVEMGKR
jgi:hypothetical protein